MSNISIPIPAVDFAPPVYLCRRAAGPLALDGRLDKPFWENAPWTELFSDIEGPHMPAPRFATRAKMLWDDENLYLGAELLGDEIWGSVSKRDDVIFYDNDFEIFIDPDSDTQQYYEFEMNVLNTVWDLFLPVAYRDGGSALNGFDLHGLRTAVHVDGKINDPLAQNRSWSVEVVIPFSAVNECIPGQPVPSPGDYYRLNFSRVQWKVDIENGRYQKRTGPEGRPLAEDNWVWSPTGVINIHYPELWGFVFFAGADGQTECRIPEDESRKWELRKLYYAEQLHCDLQGRYTDSLDTLTGLLAEYAPNEKNAALRPLPYTVAATPYSFELTCPSSRDGFCLVLCQNGRISTVPVRPCI
ncbi:MAG: carbohydrate-binding family 9-like protein [Eubacteriales bacterium]|nr:carbohydrate-binding family 9-like protein [Eubacteriales bacterium]